MSESIFPRVKPVVNMIDNKKGPFSLHFTLNKAEAEKYKIFEN